MNNGASGNVKFSCLLNSYDTGNALIGTSVTLGKESTSRSYVAANTDTTYAMYVAISGNGNFTGNNVVYEQKQEYALKFKGADYTFSNFVCKNAEVSTKNDTVASAAQGTNTNYTKDYIVEDTRDNKYYIVRKLYMRANDGTISTACWMTQNLDLDLVARYENSTQAAIYAYNRENNTITKLTTANSDLINSWTVAANTTNYMFYASTGGTNSRSQSWQTSYKFNTIAYGASPVFPIAASSGNKVNPSSDATYTPGMIDPGDIMYGPFDSTLSPSAASVMGADYCESNDTKCYQFRNNKYFAAEASGHLVSDNASGNYYKWYAATAGTGNSNVTAANTDVQGSICPKGWDLPVINDTNNGFGQLMSAYFPTAGVTKQDNSITYRIGNNYAGFSGIITLKSNSDNVFTGTPLSFPRTANVGADNNATSLGVRAFGWGATSANNAASLFSSSSSSLYPGGDALFRTIPTTMRCVQSA